MFPYKSPFSHGFPMVFLSKIAIFHRFLYVYKRVTALAAMWEAYLKGPCPGHKNGLSGSVSLNLP
jgi:hypothetical protein